MKIILAFAFAGLISGFALHIYFRKPLVVDAEPIALLRYKDTIYHCSDITKGICGLNAQCGRYNLTCIKNDFEVEYLD